MTKVDFIVPKDILGTTIEGGDLVAFVGLGGVLKTDVVAEIDPGTGRRVWWASLNLTSGASIPSSRAVVVRKKEQNDA